MLSIILLLKDAGKILSYVLLRVGVFPLQNHAVLLVHYASSDSQCVPALPVRLIVNSYVNTLVSVSWVRTLFTSLQSLAIFMFFFLCLIMLSFRHQVLFGNI